ncbi:MAG: hypothetical protein ACI9SK_001030 [Zhongshania sp.]|jgi:hypothetical protein
MYDFLTKSLKPNESDDRKIFSTPSAVFSFIEIRYMNDPQILNKAYALGRDNFDAIDILHALPTLGRDAEEFGDTGYIFRGIAYNNLEAISETHGYNLKSITKAAKRAGVTRSKGQCWDANKVVHHSRSPACLIYEIENGISLKMELFYQLIHNNAPINTLHEDRYPEKKQIGGSGYYSAKYFSKNPNRGLVLGRIYLVKLKEGGENIYKIGITENTIKKRLNAWDYEIVGDRQCTLEKAFLTEESRLIEYSDNRVHIEELYHLVVA